MFEETKVYSALFPRGTDGLGMFRACLQEATVPRLAVQRFTKVTKDGVEAHDIWGFGMSSGWTGPRTSLRVFWGSWP